MDMLRSRFLSAGLRTPSNQTVEQALERATNALMEAKDRRSEIAVEAANRACGHESSLVQMQAVDESEKIEKLESSLSTLRHVESESLVLDKEQSLENQKSLDMEIEANQQLEKYYELKEKVHAQDVKDKEAKLRNLLAVKG